MDVYRLTIEPLSSFRTPLQSDTIFGHLLWALRCVEGEGGKKALEDFLERYRAGEPPLLVSAGFPQDTLPAPILPASLPDPGGSIADRVVGAALHEALEEERYLPLAQWRTLAGRLSGEALKAARQAAEAELRAQAQRQKEQAITRTAVDRVTGSGREGRLYVDEETFYRPGTCFDVWHKLSDEALAPRLERWWRWIERNGFGQRKSAGAGAFRVVAPLHPAHDELPGAARPNGFVTLSAWSPARDDPTDVSYRTRVKRGKLAEVYALPSPWKKPLLMLKPGAVARLPTSATVREWYGRLVGDMHWTRPGIVQYGYAFPMPVKIREAER
jgi:CRISPR-associated protein Csm4